MLADAEALLTCYGVGEESGAELLHAVVELCFTSSVRFLQPGLLLKVPPSAPPGPPVAQPPTPPPPTPPAPANYKAGVTLKLDFVICAPPLAWDSCSMYGLSPPPQNPLAPARIYTGRLAGVMFELASSIYAFPLASIPAQGAASPSPRFPPTHLNLSADVAISLRHLISAYSHRRTAQVQTPELGNRAVDVRMRRHSTTMKHDSGCISKLHLAKHKHARTTVRGKT